jgi:hypothetical protein
MKSRTLTSLTAVVLLAVLAIPIQLAAQEQEEKREQKGKAPSLQAHRFGDAWRPFELP